MTAPSTTIPASADAHEHAGRLVYPDRPPSDARVWARHRDRAARTARALRTLAACWGLAVVAVFLPLLHFVLVPGLLVLGPALAWRRLHEPQTLLRAEAPCPACGAAQAFALGTGWRTRTLLRCEACGRSLELQLPERPGAAS